MCCRLLVKNGQDVDTLIHWLVVLCDLLDGDPSDYAHSMKGECFCCDSKVQDSLQQIQRTIGENTCFFTLAHNLLQLSSNASLFSRALKFNECSFLSDYSHNTIEIPSFGPKQVPKQGISSNACS